MELVELLMTVMQQPKRKYFLRPTLTYGTQGFEFNGSLFGNNEPAAKAAREAYWNENDSGIHPEWEKEPLTLDVDLPND